MSLQRFKLIRNVGKFLSYSAATEELNHKRLTLIYNENGLGKTTLIAIVRSLTNGQPIPVRERQRLGAQHAPHIVVGLEPGPDAVFQNGAWSRTYQAPTHRARGVQHPIGARNVHCPSSSAACIPARVRSER